MSSLAATSLYTPAPISSEVEPTISRGSGPKLRFNGIAVISLVSTALALATASECHSITYPPSLLYGFVLWGWWGCIASTIWRRGQRAPSAWGLSPKAIATYLLMGCVLGVIHLLLLGSLGFTVAG